MPGPPADVDQSSQRAHRQTVQGRRVLVTGGAKRVGRAIAHAIARRGADVVVHYRTSEGPAQEVADALAPHGVTTATLQADLADPAQVEGLLARAGEALGAPVDTVVNNASSFPETSLTAATYEDVDAMMRLHAWAPLALARQLHAQRDDGAVVNLLDTRVVAHDPEHVPYLLSKQALAALTQTLAIQLAPRLRVNAVAPGAILPPKGKGESYMEALREAAPLKRLGAPEDVAEAVVFLAGAPFVTGQTLFVDGGRHLG